MKPSASVTVRATEFVGGKKLNLHTRIHRPNLDRRNFVKFAGRAWNNCNVSLGYEAVEHSPIGKVCPT